MKEKFYYNYSPLDIDNYLSSYSNNRIEAIELIKKAEYAHYNDINERFADIQKLIDVMAKDIIIDGSTIDAFLFLTKTYKSLYEKGKIETDQKRKIYIFQKRFEVFKKLFSNYKKNKFVKATNNPASIKIYILLSIILNIIHINNNDYNALNSASKLIDFCLFSNYEFTSEAIILIEHAIGIELYSVNNCMMRLQLN